MVGVSGDSVRGQGLFKKAHNLNYTLLADEKGEIAKKFGVPVRAGGSLEREVLGKLETFTRGVTPARWTFVIDREGRIAYRNTKVQAGRDSRDVLEAIEKLGLTRTKPLAAGDKVPAFEVPDDTGKLWKSGDHVGKKPLVFFFFPAALTGG